jgi:hypothetical protein
VYKGMFLYPWDLAEEGVDTVLARLRDTGINTVALTASYHAGKFLRPHAPRSRVFFPADGTIYFRPSLDRYRTTPLRPSMNRLVEEHDGFALLSERRRATGLDLAAWIVCLHNTRLGTEHPAYVAHNAYGDPYYYSLCPSHPEVRAYLLALLDDFASHYDAQYVVLETPGFLPYEHGFHHEFSLVPPDPWSSVLLGLCFCPGCARRAQAKGLDADRIAAAVRGALDAYYEHPALPHPADEQATQWFVADLLSDPELAEYLRMRIELVTSLVQEVRSGLPSRMRLSVIPSVNQPLGLSWLEGADLSRLSEHADIIEVLGYRMSPGEVGADVWWARRRIGSRARLHVAVRPAYPDAPDEANLLAKVEAIRQCGVDGISFYNYGHIRLGHLAWVRRALSTLESSQPPERTGTPDQPGKPPAR